jgi:outer membrane lipoprotein-sorting protein
MDKRFRKSLVLFAVAATLVQGNSAVGLSQDWGELRRAAESIRTLKAEFTQKRHLRILETPLISKGKLYYKAPDLLRWEYLSPLKSAMLKDGEGINVYQFLEGAWKADSTQAVEVRRMIFAEINRWLKGRFNEASGFTPSYSSGPPVRITLTPGEEFKRFLNRIELVFSETPGIIRSVEMIESQEAKTRIEFTNLEINSHIPAEIFKKP